MTETFVFEPTAYTLARIKQEQQTPKRLANEFNKQYGIAIKSGFTGTQTTGGQLIRLRRAAYICELYDQPVPIELKCLIALYEDAERKHRDKSIRDFVEMIGG